MGYFRAGKKKVNQQPATVLDVARSQIGQQEVPKGSNAGPTVMGYLKAVNLRRPAYWCMAFVVWCVALFCLQHGVKNPLHKTGSVREQWQYCKLLRVSKPQPGDIFIILHKDGSGHCGFVEEVHGNHIHTIEGNSNEDGSSNGYKVCRKPYGRPISEVTGFIRPVFKD